MSRRHRAATNCQELRCEVANQSAALCNTPSFVLKLALGFRAGRRSSGCDRCCRARTGCAGPELGAAIHALPDAQMIVLGAEHVAVEAEFGEIGDRRAAHPHRAWGHERIVSTNSLKSWLNWAVIPVPSSFQYSTSNADGVSPIR